MKRNCILMFAGIAAVLAGMTAGESVLTESVLAENKDEDSLYERGLALIEKMDLKAETPEYYQLMAASEELCRIIDEIGEQDYSILDQVYVVELPEFTTDFLEELMETDLSAIPEELIEELKPRFMQAIASIATGKSGTEYLAAVSMLTSSSYFLDESLEEPVSYYYLYGTQYGGIVTFIPQEENIIVANGSFIADESLKEIKNEEDVEEWVKRQGIPGAEVSTMR